MGSEGRRREKGAASGVEGRRREDRGKERRGRDCNITVLHWFNHSYDLYLPQKLIDKYFERMAEIIKKGRVPPRIKFMLQDVQDLRANNWVQRSRQESSLKTIDQVRG